MGDQRSFTVQMLISRQTLRQFLLFRAVVDMIVSFFITPTGGGETGSPPPKFGGFVNDGRGYFEEEGLHTALFLTSSRWPSCSSPGTSEEEGLAPFPSSSHCRWILRRRPPHKSGEYFGGEGTGLPPHTVGVYFMSRVEDNDEVNILYSLTYRAVTVEGDQQIVTSAVRQSNESYQGLDLWRTTRITNLLRSTRYSCLMTWRICGIGSSGSVSASRTPRQYCQRVLVLTTAWMQEHPLQVSMMSQGHIYPSRGTSFAVSAKVDAPVGRGKV